MKCEVAAFSFGFGNEQWATIAFDYPRKRIILTGSDIAEPLGVIKPFSEICPRYGYDIPHPTRGAAHEIAKDMLRSLGVQVAA